MFPILRRAISRDHVLAAIASFALIIIGAVNV
jgi:hypothetical protein